MRQLYVRRGSRMTAAQAKAYALLDEFTLDLEDAKCTAEILQGNRKLLVEIGFGNGDALAQFASNHPEWLCIGVEVFRPGIGSLIRRCQKDELTNVRIAETDALTLLEALPDSTVDLLLVFFPDPWPKRRHHRRRLVNEEFSEIASRKLVPNGSMVLATDWEDYAVQIQDVLSRNRMMEGGPIPRYEARPKTRFEERGEKLGHNVWDFQYERVSTTK